MAIAKVVVNGIINDTSKTILDLTQVTTSSAAVASNIIAHQADGTSVIGSVSSDHSVENSILDNSFSGAYENNRLACADFRALTQMTSISLPNTVTLTGYSFWGCTSLATASFPKVEVVGEYGFYNSTSLTSVYIPLINSINQYTFYNDAVLTNVAAGSVSHVGRYAFYGCTSLPDQSWFDTIEEIGTYGFYHCTSLTSGYFPNLKRFNDPVVGSSSGSYTFSGCTGITSVYLPNLYDVGDGGYQFAACTNITQVCLPHVGSYMFDGCTALQTAVLFGFHTTWGYSFRNNTALTIMDTGNYTISASAYLNCSNLSTLILRRNQIPTLSNVNAFSGTPFASGGTGGTIYIPKLLYDQLGTGTNDYKAASNWATVDGYGTITWAQLEGSPYENYYADGKETILYQRVNANGTPKDNTWDYEWSYTDGLLSSNGWTTYNGGGTETLLSDGVKLQSGSVGRYIYMRKTDYECSDMLMEVQMYFTGTRNKYQNNRISVSDTTRGICIYPEQGYWHLYTSSTIASGVTIAPAVANQIYTIRLMLVGVNGYAWIDDKLVGTYNSHAMQGNTLTSVWSQSQDGYGIFKSIKLKKFT